MNSEEKEELIKAIGFAIGLCGSVRPEKQAQAALAAIEESHDVRRKPDPSEASIAALQDAIKIVTAVSHSMDGSPGCFNHACEKVRGMLQQFYERR